MSKKKKGISLIVLVITIIVMIILAAAIILSLNSAGIINKANEAVNETNLKQIQQIAQMGWVEAYADGKRIQPELEIEVLKYLTSNGIDQTEQNKYNIEVTTSGVTVTIKEGIGEDIPVPDEWKENVVKIVDTVPIPKGFIASKATGENTKEKGLVIYEGTEEVNDTNKETALRTRNQYVWVPVDNFNDFKRTAYTIDGVKQEISNTLGNIRKKLGIDFRYNNKYAIINTRYDIYDTRYTFGGTGDVYKCKEI